MAVADVQVGMILSYQIPAEDHQVVSHRVVEVTQDDGGTTTVQTRGDANPGLDPWTATLQGDTTWIGTRGCGGWCTGCSSGVGHGC